MPNPVVLALNPQVGSVDLSSIARRVAVPVAAVISFLIGASASAGWMVLLRFLNRTSFGLVDPVFGRDVGYYVFVLPAASAIVNFVTIVAVLALFAVVPIYLLRRDIILLKTRVTIERSAQTHVALLVALLFVATAVSIFLVQIPSLLYSTTGPFAGAAYTDLQFRAPALRLAAIIAIVSAVAVVIGARTGKLARYTLIGILVYGAVSVLGVRALPALVQKLVVVPNELEREMPQLLNHITATQEAWALSTVETRELSGEATLSLTDIQANGATIRNVRLWDREPLLQTFGQLQEIRTYYDFVSVDDDRYVIDGEYRQVLLSLRELNTRSLPTRTFVNERLTFTHGMGLTLSPVNQVTSEGLPVLFIKDLPPASDVSLQVTRPAIYYGELSSNYVFVNTRQDEFDYPAAEGNAITRYAGTGGVEVGSLLRRVMLSIRFGSKDLLFSSLISGDSRVLFHRAIRERAAKALPFLAWDSDPYAVITEAGHIKWIMDAYTFSTRYPYSQPLSDGTNYMRNSVKVVIDAYDGSVTAYVADPDDPILQTYSRIFEDIFVPLDSMPADLRAHVRYPEDLFRAQTLLFATYHMTEPEIFYHREDQWQIPILRARDGQGERFLRHIVMRLPGEGREEFIFMTPFTPSGKDNLAAWMVARMDGDRYGELLVYRFPRQSLVFGPTQIVNRMNQNTEISRQISLWDQRGSEVIRGNLLVIPIEEALIFVQALYLRAEGGRIPELKRVIVAYQNRVVMEETLSEGLTRLFG
ncbi:MAG: UPF0182 family protein, partial [Gemmatimonadales bacterium]